MSGLPLIIVFVLAIILMIVLISKFKVHPFLAIMAVSLVLAILAGIPFVDTTAEDGSTISGIPSVIGAGFSSTLAPSVS
jgi:GntP family gluconate:H+ symporter